MYALLLFCCLFNPSFHYYSRIHNLMDLGCDPIQKILYYHVIRINFLNFVLLSYFQDIRILFFFALNPLNPLFQTQDSLKPFCPVSFSPCCYFPALFSFSVILFFPHNSFTLVSLSLFCWPVRRSLTEQAKHQNAETHNQAHFHF